MASPPSTGSMPSSPTMGRISNSVRCTLCPKGCELANGEVGDCRVRINLNGHIRCTTYGQPCAIHLDPIEKKPLFHVLPGAPVLSVATVGCNLHCKQCQNWQISQCAPHVSRKPPTSPEDLVEQACAVDSPAIAYTYTEPLVSYEYTYDCCVAAHAAGLKNILVTAAYINPDPLRKLCSYIDAANVDLKSFSDLFYRDICSARLRPVLKALRIMKEQGVWLEITNLSIPTLNDSEAETRQLCDWIVQNLGPHTPLHFSRFFPQNELQHLPPTPAETLFRAREIGREAGLHHIYIGNLSGEGTEDTHCSSCGHILIRRQGYTIRESHLTRGICPFCSTPLHGVWS